MEFVTLGLPLSMLEADPQNPRKNIENIDELSASIEKIGGLLNPLIVIPKDKSEEKYIVIAGNRRLSALHLLEDQGKWSDEKYVDVKIGYELSEKEIDAIRIMDNLQRNDLNVIEEAEAFERMRKLHGMTVKEIAEEIGVSSAYISQRLALCKLGQIGKEMLLNGNISFAHARLLTRIENGQQQAMIVKMAVEEKWSTRHLEKYVELLLILTKPDDSFWEANHEIFKIISEYVSQFALMDQDFNYFHIFIQNEDLLQSVITRKITFEEILLKRCANSPKLFNGLSFSIEYLMVEEVINEETCQKYWASYNAYEAWFHSDELEFNEDIEEEEEAEQGDWESEIEDLPEDFLTEEMKDEATGDPYEQFCIPTKEEHAEPKPIQEEVSQKTAAVPPSVHEPVASPKPLVKEGVNPRSDGPDLPMTNQLEKPADGRDEIDKSEQLPVVEGLNWKEKLKTPKNKTEKFLKAMQEGNLHPSSHHCLGCKFANPEGKSYSERCKVAMDPEKYQAWGFSVHTFRPATIDGKPSVFCVHYEERKDNQETFRRNEFNLERSLINMIAILLSDKDYAFCKTLKKYGYSSLQYSRGKKDFIRAVNEFYFSLDPTERNRLLHILQTNLLPGIFEGEEISVVLSDGQSVVEKKQHPTAVDDDFFHQCSVE